MKPSTKMHFAKKIKEKISEEEDENLKLLASSLSKKSNNISKKDVTAVKKTQIPVKVKPPTEQKIQQKAKKKSESPSGAPTFKSLQAAFNALDLEELRNLLEATRLQFNNNVIMLKTAFTFLNEKLRLEKVEDLLLFDKPLDYPNNIMPESLREILQQLVQNCNNENLSYFFHNVTVQLCEDLNKSRNFAGHLILLQQIARFYPEVCIGNLASVIILRNSYQNQPSICLSLFWALGTSGSCDTTVGLKVWMEIFSSVISVKSYTKFTFDYLHKILSVSGKTPALKITLEEYKALIEILLSTDQKLKLKDLQKIKAECVGMLSSKFVKSVESSKVESVFLLMLNYSKRAPELFVNEMIECIELHPEESLNIWRLNFHTYPRPNLFFLSYLGEFFYLHQKLETSY